jgi:hypothetical protein
MWRRPSESTAASIRDGDSERGRSCARIRCGGHDHQTGRTHGRHDSMTVANDLSIRRALEAAGVEFIDENGGGPGVRLKERERRDTTT